MRSLSRLYAEALGAIDEHLLIPVRPDWLDDRDVIGSFNALSGRYEPAPGGLVDRIIAAREDRKAGRGGIYPICLDEMNLARVEHYFAALGHPLLHRGGGLGEPSPGAFRGGGADLGRPRVRPRRGGGEEIRA